MPKSPTLQQGQRSEGSVRSDVTHQLLWLYVAAWYIVLYLLLSSVLLFPVVSVDF